MNETQDSEWEIQSQVSFELSITLAANPRIFLDCLSGIAYHTLGVLLTTSLRAAGQ